MASLKDKSRSSRSSSTDVMRMVPTTNGSSRATPLDSNTPSPAELLHGRQIKTTLPAIIKQNRTVKQSEHPSNAGRTSADMMLKPGRDPLSYLPNQFGHKTPPATEGVKVLLSPRPRHSDHILWRHHKVNAEGIGHTYTKLQ